MVTRATILCRKTNCSSEGDNSGNADIVNPCVAVMIVMIMIQMTRTAAMEAITLSSSKSGVIYRGKAAQQTSDT